MTAKLLEVLIMEGVAALLFWLAYLIGVKRKMNLIAGYNRRSAERVTDEAGLARLVARLCLIVGAASALMPIATSFLDTTTRAFGFCIGSYAGIVIGTVALTSLQASEYVRSRPRA